MGYDSFLIYMWSGVATNKKLNWCFQFIIHVKILFRYDQPLLPPPTITISTSRYNWTLPNKCQLCSHSLHGSNNWLKSLDTWCSCRPHPPLPYQLVATTGQMSAVLHTWTTLNHKDLTTWHLHGFESSNNFMKFWCFNNRHILGIMSDFWQSCEMETTLRRRHFVT